jgi:folate-binding protein YgfZ
MSAVMIMILMSQIQFPDPSLWGGALLLPQMGVLMAQGPDAASFLHGQLSQDTSGQTAHEARLAAYCSPKGRMLASTVNLRPEDETFFLLTDRAVLPALLKRLSMFVMRAKAKLSDASEAVRVIGLLGSVAQAVVGEVEAEASWQVRAHAGGQLIRMPDVQGLRRWCWVGPADASEAILAALPALPDVVWAWLDVMSGVPHIEQPTVDLFVPQMINFELIGGVNFKKGCYPGQEIVARSQYRGTTKRRAFIVHALGPLTPGMEVFSQLDPSQPAGAVINAAAIPDSFALTQAPGFSALVELKLQAIDSPLFVGQGNTLALTMGALPYALPAAESAD